MPRIKKSFTFQDGDQLDVPGQPQVLHVPGHTPGEVAIHLPDRGILFSGDTLVTQCLMSGRETLPQVPTRSLNDDTQQATRALDRLRELGNVTMLPGHGKPWSGSMQEAVEQARSGSEYDKLKTVLDVSPPAPTEKGGRNTVDRPIYPDWQRP